MNAKRSFFLLLASLFPLLASSTDLAVTKSAPTHSLAVGEEITFTLVADNTSTTGGGPLDSPNTVVRDFLPPHMDFVSETHQMGSFTENGNELIFNIGFLPAGQTTTMTVTARALEATEITTNTATITGGLFDPDSSNNSVEYILSITEAIQADVLVSKEGHENTRYGDPYVYTLFVANNGPSPAENVVLTDVIPLIITNNGLPIEIFDGNEIEVNAGFHSFANNNGNISVDLGTLALNETAEIKITVRPIARGSVVNTARVTSSTPDNNSSNNEDTLVTHVRSRTWSSTSGGHSGDPVATDSGEFFFVGDSLFDLGGPMDLLFHLYHGSYLSSTEFREAGLGTNWSHNFNWHLVEAPFGGYQVILPDGGIAAFRPGLTGFMPVNELHGYYQLVEDNGAFLFYDPYSGQAIEFDEDGRLAVIHNTKGATLTITHNAEGIASVQDGRGRALSFSYQNDLLSTVSDGTRVVNFDYTNGLLTSIVDPVGNTTQYTHTSAGGLNGLIQTVVSPKGDTILTMGYDNSGRVVDQEDAMGNMTSFGYDLQGADQFVTTMELPSGQLRKHTHDGQSRLRKIEDPGGGERLISYNDADKPSEVLSPVGESTAITREPVNGQLASVQFPDSTGPVTFYSTRIFRGLQITQMSEWHNPDSTSESFTYDAFGNLASRTDAAGNTWSFTHNNLGQVLTKTHPLGGTVIRTYDARSNLETVTDPAGNTLEYAYDSLNRRIKVTRADGQQTSYTYDALDRVTAERTDGRETTFVYDPNGNLTRISKNGSTTNYTYDAADRLVKLEDNAGNSTTYSYDTNGNVSSVTDPIGRTQTYVYDDQDRLLSRSDGEGREWSYAYDVAGRLVESTTPGSATTTYTYDSRDLITGVSGPAGDTMVEFDSMGRLAHVTDLGGATTAFTYSDTSRSNGIFTGSALETNMAINGIGKVGAVSDSEGHTWTYAFDSSGRRISSTDPLDQVTQYAYDSRNRLVQVHHPDSTVIHIAYDPFGNITSLIGPDNLTAIYSYDDFDRLVASNAFNANYDSVGDPVSINDLGFTYDDARQLTQITHTDNSTVSYSYDNSGRVRSVNYHGPVHQATVTYAYDSEGLRSSLNRSNGITTSYLYDAANRLVRQTDHDNGTTIIDLVFDRNARGDIASATRTQPLDLMLSDTSTTFTFNPLNQVDSFTYDPIGRRTLDDSFTYGYDALSRLVRLEGEGRVSTFTYDGLGQVLSRTDSSTGSTQFRWNYALDLPGVAEMITSGGSTKYVYAPSGELLLSVNANQGVRFYHFDEAGNTLLLTNGEGDETASYAYTPYGHVAKNGQTDNNPFTFGGQAGIIQLTDSHFLMRQRVYDNHTRQFLTPDPLAQKDPLKLNEYSYAAGNPIRYMDPTGLNPNTAGSSGFDTAGTASTGVSTVANIVETATGGLQAGPHLPGGSSANVVDGIADRASDALRRTGKLQAKALDNLDGRRVNDLYDRAKDLSDTADRARDAGSKAKGAGNVATIVGVGAALGETAIDVGKIVDRVGREKVSAYSYYFSAVRNLNKAVKEGKITTREATRRLGQIMRLLDDQLDGIEDSAEADLFFETGEGLVESLKAMLPFPTP